MDEIRDALETLTYVLSLPQEDRAAFMFAHTEPPESFVHVYEHSLLDKLLSKEALCEKNLREAASVLLDRINQIGLQDHHKQLIAGVHRRARYFNLTLSDLGLDPHL